MQAIVQLRGDVNLDHGVEDTLDMLNVGRVNHATFVPETDSYRGMITKVNDVVAFGEPSVEAVARTVARRGEPLEGSADIDDEWIDDNTDYADLEALAEALVDEETTPATTGRADVTMQKSTDKQGIPDAVGRAPALDNRRDDVARIRLPEFLRRG